MTAQTSVPLPEPLTRNLESIERSLQNYLRGDSPLEAAARYAMGWEDRQGRPVRTGGKRIRPALCLLAGECLGASPARCLPGAAAIEFVHNFSLVHDDLQDRDIERHGRPTAWVVFGEAQAINLGDFLSTTAFGALLDAPSLSPEVKTNAVSMLNGAIREMIQGQWRDIDFESQTEVSVEQYFAMVSGKTGALLAASAGIGAILGGADEEISHGLQEWARQLGLAFQVRDDYLGVWGSSEATGKAVGADIARRKRSMPVLMGMAHPASAAVVQQHYANDGDPDVDVVVAALNEAGIDEAVIRIAHEQRDAADELLAQLSLGEVAQRELREVSDFLVERIH